MVKRSSLLKHLLKNWYKTCSIAKGSIAIADLSVDEFVQTLNPAGEMGTTQRSY